MPSPSTQSVSIVGRCPTLTSLVRTDAAAAVVEASGAGVEVSVRSVLIRGVGMGLRAVNSAHLTFREGWIVSTSRYAVFADGGSILLEDASIGPPFSVSNIGASLFAANVSHIVARRVALTGVHTLGVAAVLGADVTVEDFTLYGSDTPPADTEIQGGIYAMERGTVTLRRGVIQRIAGPTVWATSSDERAENGGHIDVHDVVIKEGRVATNPEFKSCAAFASRGATVSLDHVAAINAQANPAVVAATGDSEMTVQDTLIRGSTWATDAPQPRALSVGEGCRLHAQRVRMESIDNAAVVIQGADTRADLTDVVVDRVTAIRGGEAASGLIVSDHATVQVEGLAVRRTSGFGILIKGEQSGGQFSNVLVDQVDATHVGVGTAIGIHAREGARADFRRTGVYHVVGVGVLNLGSAVTLDQSTISELIALPLSTREFPATGVSCALGGTLSVRRSSVVNVPGCSVQVVDAGSTLTFGDSAVLSTQVYDGSGAVAFFTYRGGTLRVDHAYARGNFYEGVIAWGDQSRVDLSRSMIDGTVDRPSRDEPRQTVVGGFGLHVLANARCELSQTSIRDVGGSAIVASIGVDADQQPTMGAVVHGADVFVSGVRVAPLGTAAASRPPSPPTARVVWSDRGSTIALQRSVVDGGQFGLFTSCGSLTLDQGVVMQQSVAAAAENGRSATHTLELSQTGYWNNHDDRVAHDISNCEDPIASYDFANET